jgi:hypothetical protein
LIADYERQNFSVSQCVWPPTFSQEIIAIKPPITISNNSSNTTNNPSGESAVSHGLPAGAVAGIIVGILALAICGILIFLRVKYKPQRINGRWSLHPHQEETNTAQKK